ncbi:hypothetical protein F4780DRAFT_75811 [Xylariomycetidae sp. FL0641]|nr:hypothetical protein F4780DRAFT_75811 [Xylariomycetidae sp. FL0641]
MADRPRYTHAQLEQYFDRVGLPAAARVYGVAELPGGAAAQLGFLRTLLRHQLTRVPFENLAQHYSWHRAVDPAPRRVFRKMVLGEAAGRNRGGYCMENNSLLHTVLLSLGFTVYLAGARVFDEAKGRYGGFSHCVNVVVIGDAQGERQRYLLDVGFGANGPVAPLLLQEDEEEPAPHVPPAQVRLRREPIPQQVDQSRRVWVYQQRVAPAAAWRPLYCFVDVEFLLEDIRGLNWSPWRDPTSFFTRKVVVSRFTTDAERDDDDDDDGPGGVGRGDVVVGGAIDGALILFEDSLKWRRGGETVMEVKLESEGQRIDALRRYFGIELDEEDREAIRGTVSEIVGPQKSLF